MYRIGEAASLLGVHPNTIRRWEKEGRIRIVRVGGGHRRIPESEISRILAQEEKPAAPGSDFESGLRSFLNFVFTHCSGDRELVKRAIMVRDSYRCRICGSGGNIDVREKTPGIGPTEENLITVCEKCAKLGSISEKKPVSEEKGEEITKSKILSDLSPSGLAQRVAFGEILSAALALRKFSLRELTLQSKSPEPLVRIFCERMEGLGYLRRTDSGYEVAVNVVG